MFCEQCGSKQDSNQGFCVNCGAQLEKKPTKVRKKTVTILVPIIMALCILLMGGYIIYTQLYQLPKQAATPVIDTYTSKADTPVLSVPEALEEPNQPTVFNKFSKEPIRIGLLTPKTGQVAQYGIAIENAVNIAVEEVNAAGGINGCLVELISYDNKADATESINLFNRLVENDKIVALIGPIISSTSLAVAPLVEEKKIPMISPTATNLAVTSDYNYVFRACYTDPYQGSTLAKFARENLDANTAAVLYNDSDDYSTGLAIAFKDYFEATGGTITNYEGYTGSLVDFTSVLTKIKEQQPDVLFNPDYYNTSGIIADQVKEVELQTIMLGGDGWDDIQKDYANAVEGYYFANHFAIDDTDRIVQDFINAYQNKYDGTMPNALSALGYDATKIMLEAIEKARSTDGEKILRALQTIHMRGVTGELTFDNNGNPLKSIPIIKIENGLLKLEAKIR